MMKAMETPVVTSTALLKVKYVTKPMNPENMSFEDFIENPNTVIKLEFPDGKALVEAHFRSTDTPMTKYYVEFFDAFNRDDMIAYLTSEASDYRVTTLDGSVIRMSKEDERMVATLGEGSIENLPEYEFKKERMGFFQRIKNRFQKKDA